jgi:hypothetical protein
MGALRLDEDLAVTWLWIVLYLIVGIVVARWFTARSSPVSPTDAFALVAVWPGFLVFLALKAGVNPLGGLADGKDWAGTNRRGDA